MKSQYSAYRAETKALLSALLVAGALFSGSSAAEMESANLAPAKADTGKKASRGLAGLSSFSFAAAPQLARIIHSEESQETFVLQQVRRRLPPAFRNQADQVAREIMKTSRKYGFDPIFLMSVIQHESKFSPTIIGRAGEIGLMQIKPTTAAWIHDRSDSSSDEESLSKWRQKLADPVQNVKIGGKYLSMLRERFQSHGSLYLAAYNMGTTKLMRSLKTKRVPRQYASKVLKEYVGLYAEFRRSSSSSFAVWPSSLASAE